MHREMNPRGRLMKHIAAAAFALALLTAPAQAADARDCGTVVVPPNSDITSFSPLFADLLANGQAAELMYPALIWLNAQDDIDWSRSLASAITSPDNGLTYDITLRPWTWSDGVPVTSADVLYNFKLIKALGPEYPGYGSGGMPFLIKSITAPDASHVQIVLTHPVNAEWFIYNGISQLQPLPAHDWSRYSLDQIFQLQSTPSFYHVVDGPLKLVSFRPGLTATYVPNPAWPGPKMHFKRFVFDTIESDGAALQQVEAGEIDFTAVPTEFWRNVQHLPGLHLVYLPPQSTWDYIGLNFRNPKVAFLRDVRVRDAIQDAIDQKGLIKLALHGQGYAVYGPITSADGQFMAPQLRAGDYPVGYDPARARALLAQAGFSPGPDGI
ncbi:MAG: ABC transporter substrate-binding protein, partial [Acidocella sp.]|nr:ABC transporter substrate-binding protein [Acidocella sp.]